MDTIRRAAIAAVIALLSSSVPVAGQGLEHPQHPPGPGARGSANIEVVAHVPLGMAGSVSDIEIEQDPERPYAYVARRVHEIGFDVIDLSDPYHARVIHRWRIENPDLHVGGAMDGRYFKHEGRTYYVQSVQFSQGGPNADVGAIVFDMTDLPDKVVEVGRIRQPDSPGGFHNMFMYRHSNGKPLLFATSGQYAKVFDMDLFLKSGGTEMDAVLATENRSLSGLVPVAESEDMWANGYHDFYVAYHPESGQDRFYGGGGSGYYVYNISDLARPELLATVLDVPGVPWGHTFTPTPDGRYAVAETEFQYAPLRIFDLKPALDGVVDNIDEPVGVWHADWKSVAHNHEVRWPFVFVAGYQTGLSVFDMTDPTLPFTVAYYDTFDGVHDNRSESARMPGSPYTWNVYDGAWGVDVRNADGLIVVSDMTTGFWAFRMQGFHRWYGPDWGMPDVSSAQPWDGDR